MQQLRPISESIPMDPLTFNPDAFEVTCLDHARQVTVGTLDFRDGEVVTTDSRWDSDTAYTLSFIRDHFDLKDSSRVLDYGCGTGRIAKALIAEYGCHVIGVDASPSMLSVARSFVNAPDRFTAMACDELLSAPGHADLALCLWVLQHSGSPTDDVIRIYQALKPGGCLLLFNENIRYVPTLEQGFVNDGVDVRIPLAEIFGHPVATGTLDPNLVHWKFAFRTFWSVYQKI